MANTSELLQPSKLMQAILPQMQEYRAGYEGGRLFKSLVIQKRPKESELLFKEKFNSVAAMPVCKSIVEELTDIVFESEPIRHLEFLNAARQKIETPLWVEEFIDNADYKLNSLSAVVESAAKQAGVEGWSWIFVDLPESATTSARPYLSVANADQVLDWEYETIDGVNTLTYLRVKEYEDDTMTVVKVWQAGGTFDVDGELFNIPTTCERYVINTINGKQESNVEVDAVFTFPGYPIPVIQVLPQPDPRNDKIGVSDLTDAIDVQKEMLKLEVEAFDSIRYSKPIIRANAGVQIPAGGGGIARGEKDSIEVFAVTMQDVAAIRDQQKALIDNLDAFTGRSGMRSTSTTNQSGISIVEERRQLHRKAAGRARVLETVEEMIFQYASILMGIYWDGEIEYNTDYEARDTQFKLALLKQAKELSPSNAVVQSIIDEQVIAMISKPEEVTMNLMKNKQQPVENTEPDINNVNKDTPTDEESEQ